MQPLLQSWAYAYESEIKLLYFFQKFQAQNKYLYATPIFTQFFKEIIRHWSYMGILLLYVPRPLPNINWRLFP